MVRWYTKYGVGIVSITRPCVVRVVHAGNTQGSTRYVHIRRSPHVAGAPPDYVPVALASSATPTGHYVYDWPWCPDWKTGIYVGLSSTLSTWTATPDGAVVIVWRPIDG